MNYTSKVLSNIEGKKEPKENVTEKGEWSHLMYMTYMCINLKIHYLPRVSSGLENYTNNEPFSTFIYLL